MIARKLTAFLHAGNLSSTLTWLVRISAAIVACFMLLSLAGCNQHLIGVLNPKGIIAYQERKLFFDSLALMLIVVLPVIIMSLTFVYHYQISHRIADYKPDWSHNYFLEAIWWGIPCVIIVILGILTWKATYELDPYRKIASSNTEPMVIEAIALPWKWLFIYPEQGIATINYLVIPVGQQVVFVMTADNVPMSAFFIPQLGGQIYAMAGMSTRLHLLASEVGVYDGMNTQFNGQGFSDMHFSVQVVEPKKMQPWIDAVKKSSSRLTDATYTELLVPSIGNKPQFFSDASKDLYKSVLLLYQQTYGTTHPRHEQGKFYKD